MIKTFDEYKGKYDITGATVEEVNELLSKTKFKTVTGNSKTAERFDAGKLRKNWYKTDDELPDNVIILK